jgi:hypothetical protein
MTKRIFLFGTVTAILIIGGIVFALLGCAGSAQQSAVAMKYDKSQDEGSDGKDFKTKVLPDNTLEITAYSGGGGTLVIPDIIKRRYVTVIGPNAFSSKGITAVTIPETVHTIGAGAFKDNPLQEICMRDHELSLGMASFSQDFLFFYDEYSVHQHGYYANFTGRKGPERVPRSKFIWDASNNRWSRSYR